MGRDFKLSHDLVRQAYKEGMSLSAFLEKQDPTAEYGSGEQLDAFGRCMKDLDIRTTSDYTNGVAAHNFERFYDNSDGRGEERTMLAAEWMSRVYRGASAQLVRKPINIDGNYSQNGMIDQTRLFDQEAPISYTLFPPTVLPELRFVEIQPTALPYLLARTRTISTEAFMSIYLNDSVATTEMRMSRVEEWAEVPVVNLLTSDHTIRVKKFGRRLRQSYEQMRRMNLDLIAWSIQYIAARAARDKEDAALDILVNGDGNTSTAATSNNGSTYDAAAAGQPTLKMWMGFRQSAFVRPYRLTTVIMPNADVVKLYLLQAASANIAPSMVLQTNQPQAVVASPVRTTFDGVQVIDNNTLTAGTWLGIDRTAALEMVVEANADIVETDRIISRQYQEIVLTESLGFALATLNQNQTLVTGS